MDEDTRSKYSEKKIDFTDLDKRILKQLLYHGIDPHNYNLNDLATKLKINPYTLNYKIKKFFDNRVFLEKVFRFNYSALGLSKTAWVFFILGKNVSFSTVAKKLMNYKNIRGVYLTSGDYNLAAKIVVRDFDHLTDILTNIESEFREEIRTYESVIASETYKQSQKPLLNSDLNFITSYSQLSDNEKKILNYLVETNNEKITDIVKGTGLHRNTVSVIMKKFYIEKIVLKQTPIVNSLYKWDVDTNFKGIMFFNVNPGTTDDVAKSLVKLDQVHELYKITSNHNLLAVTRTKDIDSFYDFYEMLNSSNEISRNIHRIKTNIAFSYETNMFTKELLKEL